VFAEALRRNLQVLELELSAGQLGQLETHFKLLNRWNKVLNLTRIQDIEEVVQLHYCESLFLGTQLPFGALKIVDVGSGAGFPGIPVAILRAECSTVLVECHQRKAVFLNETRRSIESFQVLNQRLEDVSERFDWAISRAVNLRHIDDSLKRIAPNIAALAGEDPPDDRSTWNKIKVPYGNRRFLWLHSST